LEFRRFLFLRHICADGFCKADVEEAVYCATVFRLYIC